MRFRKVHELGNDFILFDGRDVEDVDWRALAQKICDRHTGVGADGVLILQNSAIADVRMRVLHADGSEAGMYSGGIRAFARCCFENGVVRGTQFSVETDAGVKKPRVILKDGRVDGVRVDMGEPILDAKDVPAAVEDRAIGMELTAGDRTFPLTAVRVGVPYAVVFVDSVNEADVLKYGPLIENDPLFPAHADVDFVQVLSPERVRMRTWERGCTLACGSGACAAAVACVLNGRTARNVAVEVALGTLFVEWSQTDNRLYLTGPAETIFSGVWNL